MAKIGGVETNFIIVRSNAGEQIALPVEDSGAGGGSDYSNLNAFLSIDDGAWIPINKTDNWQKGLDNFIQNSNVHTDFTSTGGTTKRVTAPQCGLNFWDLMVANSPLIDTLNKYHYGCGHGIVFVSDVEQSGKVTGITFSKAPGANRTFMAPSVPGEAICSGTLTFKADDGLSLPKIALIQTGYSVDQSGCVCFGWFNLPTPVIANNNVTVTVKLKFTW